MLLRDILPSDRLTQEFACQIPRLLYKTFLPFLPTSQPCVDEGNHDDPQILTTLCGLYAVLVLFVAPSGCSQREQATELRLHRPGHLGPSGSGIW